MKLKQINSISDFYLLLHLSIQLYGHFLILLLSSLFDLTPSLKKSSDFLIGVYILLLGQKVNREGASVPVFLSITTETAYILRTYRLLPVCLSLLPDLSYISFLISLSLFQRFEIPRPPGPFRPGYRRLELPGLENRAKRVAVFYPTEETKEDVAWMPREQELFELYKYSGLFGGAFRRLVDLLSSFTHYIPLGVNLNGKIADLGERLEGGKGYPVVIFSHGYGGNRHMYSVFTNWLASQGAIVLSTEHSDEKKPDLQPRYELIRAVLDFLYDQKRVNDLFEQEISLDYTKISLAGHSLGGGTAIYGSLFDQRVTGGVIAFDPFVTGLSPQLLNLAWSRPCLVISSLRFNAAIGFLKNHEKIEALMRGNRDPGRSLFCYLGNSSHLQQGDLVCLCPRLMRLARLIDRKGDPGELLELNLKLMELFFSEVVMKGGLIETVRQQFSLHLKEKMGLDEKTTLKVVL